MIRIDLALRLNGTFPNAQAVADHFRTRLLEDLARQRGKLMVSDGF